MLLCSDGLSDLVSDEVVGEILSDETQGRDEAVSALVEHALAAGGRDNITVLLVDVVSEAPSLPDESQGETLELPVAQLMNLAEKDD